jgi:esterase/lipase
MSKIFNGKKKIIISFSGQGNGMGSLPQFEFVHFLEKYYNKYERHFYLDKYKKWYHNGIEGISKNIDETLQYLKNIIVHFEEVIFIGSSAGGYAAILFGSLLDVHKIIAFKPQTISIQDKYTTLKPFINTTTKYYIYGDLTIDKEKDPYHHISHCENITIYPNVILNTDYEIDLKKLRDQGILKNIMQSIIEN